MPLKDIFNMHPDSCISARDVREIVCCLLDKMGTIPEIANHPDFSTFTPDAILRTKFDGDFVTYDELKQVRCCINDFLINFNLSSGNSAYKATAATEIVVAGYAAGFNPSMQYIISETMDTEVIKLGFLSIGNTPIVTEPVIIGSFTNEQLTYANRGYGLAITNVVDILNNAIGDQTGLEFFPYNTNGDSSRWLAKYTALERIRLIIIRESIKNGITEPSKGITMLEFNRAANNFADWSDVINIDNFTFSFYSNNSIIIGDPYAEFVEKFPIEISFKSMEPL